MRLKRIYWLVDDDLQNARDYKELLQSSKGHPLKIEIVAAQRNLKDYLPLLNDERTGGFILDQRLNELQPTNCSGLDLADYLRSYQPEIPIFILTQYSDPSLEQRGSAVEQIILKPDVRKNLETYATRLLRRLREFELALSEQQKRLKSLIDKKVNGKLTSKEREELDQIRSTIERPTHIVVDEEELEWEQGINKQHEILANLQTAISALNTVSSKPKPKRRQNKYRTRSIRSKKK